MSVKISCDKKKKDSLETALETKERRRRTQRKKEEKESSQSWESWESDHVGLHHHPIITEQCP